MASICKIAILVAILAGICAAEDNNTSEAPINCYVCNSKIDEKCKDPIDKDNVPFDTVPCPSGYCYKYHQELEDDIKRVSRGCTTGLEPAIVRKEEKEGCIFSTGTKSVQICNCLGDKCNGAEIARSTALVLTTAALMTFLAHLLY